MAFKFDKSKVYMMPVFFGPSYCQQQPWEGGKTMAGHYQPGETNVFALTYETDADILEQYIPSCYTLVKPYVTVNLCEFTNLGWLNGKTYNLININVPVHFKGQRDDVDGDLVLAMFENHCDPIVGGRETMGYSKLYCDIPRVQHCEGKCIALASAWDFRFMKMVIDTKKPAEDPETLAWLAKRTAGKMHYKCIPKTMEKGEDPRTNYTQMAIEEPTLLPNWVRPDDYPYPQRKPEPIICSGTIEWSDPTWEDWPTNGNVGHGLYTLQPKRIIGAKVLTYDEPCEYTSCYVLR